MMFLASVQTYLEAALFIIDKHRFESPRSMPDFHPNQPKYLFNLAHEIDREFRDKLRVREIEKRDYYIWRKNRLDELAMERKWTVPERNLASSVLSTVKDWERYKKRNVETQQRIDELLDGAELLFPALGIQFQQRLNSYERRSYAINRDHRPV